MAWADAMRVISDETRELIDQVRDPDCDHVGPFVKGQDVEAILDFLYDHGLVVPDGADFAVLADDEDEEDESIRGDDDEDELLAWCPGCRCERTFTVLPDSEVEGDVDPDWTYWCCPMCQCAPRLAYGAGSGSSPTTIRIYCGTARWR